MHITDLIAIISKIYEQKVVIASARTKLIKLAYLAEFYFTRLTGKKIDKPGMGFQEICPLSVGPR